MKRRPLDRECLEARIAWRVAQLELLAARTAVAYWRDRMMPPVIQCWDNGILIEHAEDGSGAVSGSSRQAGAGC